VVSFHRLNITVKGELIRYNFPQNKEIVFYSDELGGWRDITLRIESKLNSYYKIRFWLEKDCAPESPTQLYQSVDEFKFTCDAPFLGKDAFLITFEWAGFYTLEYTGDIDIKLETSRWGEQALENFRYEVSDNITVTVEVLSPKRYTFSISLSYSKFREDGESCEYNKDCKSENCINGICCKQGQFCCNKHSDCKNNTFCGPNYFCEKKLENGKKCLINESCLSGFCNFISNRSVNKTFRICCELINDTCCLNNTDCKSGYICDPLNYTCRLPITVYQSAKFTYILPVLLLILILIGNFINRRRTAFIKPRIKLESCPSCKLPIPEGVLFCTNCGIKLVGEESEEVPNEAKKSDRDSGLNNTINRRKDGEKSTSITNEKLGDKINLG
jgi:hypothetical protein